MCIIHVDGSANIGTVTCGAVSSASLPGMEVGQQFDTGKEVMEYVADFAKRYFHPLRRSSCTTIEAYNRKVNTRIDYAYCTLLLTSCLPIKHLLYRIQLQYSSS